MFPEALTPSLRRRGSTSCAGSATGSAQEGYRGFFEVDVLIDVDSNEVYLGELNPRISGASAITNVTAGAYADVPLFLFHLLEFMGVEYELDVAEINERWEGLASVDLWSQMIIKETVDVVEQITGGAARPAQYAARRRRQRWCSAARPWTGTSCRTRTSASSCASTVPATTAGRAPTSACS